MKRKIAAAFIAAFLLIAPVQVFAQDDEPEPTEETITAAERVEAQAVIDGSNFFDLGMWIMSAITLLSLWGGMVSIVVIDKGIKNVVLKILTAVPGEGEWKSVIRIIVIYGAVVVACWLAVDENGWNIFVSAPQQVLDMIPSIQFQLWLTAGALALSVFLTHNVVKWFTSDDTPPQAVKFDAAHG